MLNAITDKTFSGAVASEKPLLVDFWGDWCGPCKLMVPALEELAEEFKDSIDIVALNVAEQPMAPSKIGIISVPSFVIFKEGEVLGRRVGATPKVALKAWIEACIHNA